LPAFVRNDILVPVLDSDDTPGPNGSDPAPPDPAPEVHQEAPALEVHQEAQIREQLRRLERQLGPLVELAERTGRSAGSEFAHEASRLGPAWRRATSGELRWPVSAVIAAMIAMQLLVPGRLSLTGRWLVPALEIVLLAVLVISNPARITSRSPVLRAAGLALIATASLTNAYSAARLVIGLVNGTEGTDAASLLATGANIWLTNVIIFGLWYWELDRGGPASRALALKTKPSFLFPEMTAPDLADPGWEPLFLDYLYVSFTNATAFSPTDTLPFSRWAKSAMMLQSAISLITVVMVIARAVNILK
jgi:uncharacterized membrane protein